MTQTSLRLAKSRRSPLALRFAASAAGLALLAGISGCSSPAPGSGADPHHQKAAASSLLTDHTVVGWASHNLETLAAEERELGATNGMLSTFVDFASQNAFPESYLQAAEDRRAALLIAWEPYDMYNKSVDQPQFKPRSIAEGAYDSYIKHWLAEAQKGASKATVLVRFAPEMNEAHRPWSVGTNGGNTPADYVSMWRHVYAIKQQVAPDILMMWNPLVAGSTPDGTPVDLASVYPGVDSVDVLGLDGYNWADAQKPEVYCGWQSYDDVFSTAVAEIKKLAAGKPWGIAETGSVPKPLSFFEPGGECFDSWGSWVFDYPESGQHYQTPEDWITQHGWVKTMIENARDDGAQFVNLFNVVKEVDWRLNSTPEGQDVLRDIEASTQR